MHRIEGENIDVSTGVNLFKDTPPYTVATPAWCNALQEEIMNVIISSGQAVLAENSDSRDQLWTAITGLASVPVGAVIPWLTGYYGAPANGGGFTPVTIDLPPNWTVCDGSAVNDPNSPIFDGAGRFLPDLTDDRFLMGDIAGNMGATGGINTQSITIPAHYHSMGTGADLNISASGSHYHDSYYDGFIVSRPGSGVLQALSGGTTYTIVSPTQSETHAHASGNFSGRIGLVTGGENGNTIMTAGGTTENRPQYIACRYIMRIK